MNTPRFLTLLLVALAAAETTSACQTKFSCSDYYKSPGCETDGGATSSSSNRGGDAGSDSGGANSGGNSGSPSDGGTSGTKTTTAPCSGKCSGSTPVCNTDTNKCVACLENSDCTDSTKPVCDTSTNKCVGCLASSDCSGTTPVCNTTTTTCVACLANTDCTSATASRCDTTTNTCATCSADSDCSQISGENVCNAGTCVQCTAAKETACGTYSCNPATSACTTTVRGTIGKCLSCLADSECIGGDVATPTSRCVPMTFNGATHGNYCLQRVVSAGTSGCAAPYSVAIAGVSVSAAASETYCGINQNATTCEAIVDMIASKTCSIDTDCGSGQGGLCKTVGTNPNRCTIPCDSAAQCLASAPGNTCTSDVPYCH